MSTSSTSSASSTTSNILLISSTCCCLVAVYLWTKRETPQAKHNQSVEEQGNHGPMFFPHDNPEIRVLLLDKARRRASLVDDNTNNLQKNASPLSNQVGGLSSHKLPLLQMPPMYVLKPLHKDVRGTREVALYESMAWAKATTTTNDSTPSSSALGSVFHSITTGKFVFKFLWRRHGNTQSLHHKQPQKQQQDEVILLRSLSSFVAPYFGVVDLPNQSYLVLQDLSLGYNTPCIMDLKMGTQSYEPTAPQHKRFREIAKYPQQATFGFRIVGMQMDNYKRYDKHHGRSLTTYNDVLQALQCYFYGDKQDGPFENNQSSSRGRTSIILCFVKELQRLYAWFQHANTSLTFYSSSLLLIYDVNHPKVTLKMIDFGHVTRQTGGDVGYRHGLQTLMKMLQQLIQENKK